ncbi:MAG TPA: hypothetical protein VLE96_03510 [Chlamydiales bacterium]|nr:hypothetical protein [Chlamydiales bacterium]
MNFTRDPIIETVITPREGCKLVIRNSKITSQESFQVDAIEVVSFGHSLFFRSQERPKSFLVPVSDYEVTESKEAKMVLKTTQAEQSIKIGGGREARPQREEEDTNERPAPESHDRKRDNKRRRGRRGRDRSDYVHNEAPKELAPIEAAPESEQQQPEEPKEKVSFISKLFPPPPTLIKETIGRYKTSDPALEDFPTEDFESGQGHTPEEETTDEQ